MEPELAVDLRGKHAAARPPYGKLDRLRIRPGRKRNVNFVPGPGFKRGGRAYVKTGWTLHVDHAEPWSAIGGNVLRAHEGRKRIGLMWIDRHDFECGLVVGIMRNRKIQG